MLPQPWNPLTVQESSEDSAVALLLRDKKSQRRYELRIGRKDRMRRSPPHEPAAACPVAQLEMLNGSSNKLTLRRTEQIGVMPWDGPWKLTVLEKVSIPVFIA